MLLTTFPANWFLNFYNILKLNANTVYLLETNDLLRWSHLQNMYKLNARMKWFCVSAFFQLTAKSSKADGSIFEYPANRYSNGTAWYFHAKRSQRLGDDSSPLRFSCTSAGTLRFKNLRYPTRFTTGCTFIREGAKKSRCSAYQTVCTGIAPIHLWEPSWYTRTPQWPAVYKSAREKLTRSGVSYVLAKYIHKANTAVDSFFRRLHRIVSGILKQCILLRQAKSHLYSWLFRARIYWDNTGLRKS